MASRAPNPITYYGHVQSSVFLPSNRAEQFPGGSSVFRPPGPGGPSFDPMNDAVWCISPLAGLTITQTLCSWLHRPYFRFWECFERSTSQFGVQLFAHASADPCGGYAAGPGASLLHRSVPSTCSR